MDSHFRVVYAGGRHMHAKALHQTFAIMENVEVYFVMDYDDCLAAIQSAEKTLGLPDVVFLDFELPDCGGLRACQLLRERFDSLKLPIIMVTPSLSKERHTRE